MSAMNAGVNGWMLRRMSEAAWAELGVVSALVQGRAVSVLDRAQDRPERDEAWPEKYGRVPGPASVSGTTATSRSFCSRPTSSGLSTDVLRTHRRHRPRRGMYGSSMSDLPCGPLARVPIRAHRSTPSVVVTGQEWILAEARCVLVCR